LVITSPNADFVPELPVERRIISTFSDGRWGIHEYSRWPQVLVPDMLHLACIPRSPSEALAPAVLWEDLSPPTSWTVDPSLGVHKLGFIKPEIATPLIKAATSVSASLAAILPSHAAYTAYGKFLSLALQHAVQRMEILPSRPGIAVAVAAHVQRLALEMCGLVTYLDTVRPRIEDSRSYFFQVLPVLGTFVRDPTSAQTCHRVGIPFWFVQPFTPHVKVWQVVDIRPLPSVLAGAPCVPPIHHRPDDTTAGVTNLTGHWLRAMTVSVSETICGIGLSDLDGIHQSAETGPEFGEGAILSAAPSSSVTSTSDASPSGTVPHTSRPLNSPSCHPSRIYTESIFRTVSETWIYALQAVSPVAEPPRAAVYFYPPPFLLDAVDGQYAPPSVPGDPLHARVDAKIVRYVHNLVRIRKFCRTRLFDHTTSNAPLTIAEWRAALWGDYAQRDTNIHSSMIPSDSRKVKRRLEGRNSIVSVFENQGLFSPYSPDMCPHFAEDIVSVGVAAEDMDLRSTLIWESHEVNFRCELMALDSYLVRRPDWTALHRWDRESAVSAVWGEPSSVLSVLPSNGPGATAFCWPSVMESSWATCCGYLRAFVHVLRHWPNCPGRLSASLLTDQWDEDMFGRVQREAVEFYVRTFTRVYQRLPVAPVRVQSGDRRKL
ncbi:hypothetical protein C8Q78DRAFT_973369, partial [Trametes maxima]